MLSIIVTSYWPKARPYLDLCIESIGNAAIQCPHEVLIVAPKSYAPQYPNVNTISPPEESYHNPRALNYGITAAKGDMLLVLNDDTILTRHSIVNLMGAAQQMPKGIVMPLSNDQQRAYMMQVPHTHPGPLPRDMEPHVARGLMEADSPHLPGLILPESLCMYAFMMHKSFYQKVGPFDENLKTGFDDTDYCIRARALGGTLAIMTSALIYHFGGVSADNTLTAEIRKENEAYFRKKWSV